MTLSLRIASVFSLRKAFANKVWGPFTFEIDRPRGYVKTWDQPDGSKVSYKYPVDYGFLTGHTGEDGEDLDAFVGDDPTAPIESFLKMKPGPDGSLVPDETKFLIGLTADEREKVLGMYPPEWIVGLRKYTDFYELVATLHAFKNRGIKTARAAKFNPQILDTMFGNLQFLELVDYVRGIGLPEIGEGGSRIVFALDSKHVLKIAKTKGGVDQNNQEWKLGHQPLVKSIVTKVLAVSKYGSWLVSEIAREISGLLEFESVTGIPWLVFQDFCTLCLLDHYKFEEAVSELEPEYLEDRYTFEEWKKIISSPFLEHTLECLKATDLAIGDITKLSSWGKTADQRAVLLDSGYTYGNLKENIHSASIIGHKRYAFKVQDKRSGNKDWFLFTNGKGDLVLLSEDKTPEDPSLKHQPPPADYEKLYYFLRMKGLVSTRELDLDPDVWSSQTRYKGHTNFNGNNVSRDSFTIPYGSSQLAGEPRTVYKILQDLLRLKVIDPEWFIINSPEYRGKTVGDVLKIRPHDPVDEIAHKTTGKVILYHGTSEKKWLGGIKTKGLRPGRPTSVGGDPYADQIPGYSEKNVYLTSSIPEAEKYATRASSYDHSPAVVLRVEVNDLTKFVLDEDAAGILNGFDPEDDTTYFFGGTHVTKFPPTADRPWETYGEEDWRKSPNAEKIESLFQQKFLKGLRKQKTIAYRGSIPPNKIKVIESYAPVKMRDDPKFDHDTADPPVFESSMNKVRQEMNYDYVDKDELKKRAPRRTRSPKDQMAVTADLNPPLGVNGGPCKVVDRIEQAIRDPRLQHHLVDEVETGKPLENSEARMVYPVESESGGPFRSFKITSHGQYRLDLRGITVKDLQRGLEALGAQLKFWRVRKDPLYEQFFDTRGTYSWLDPKSKLFMSLLVDGDEHSVDVTVVTAFRKGQLDPKPTECDAHKVAFRYMNTPQ